MSGLAQDGTVDPISRDQILRRERGPDNEHDWQPYPVDVQSLLEVKTILQTTAVCMFTVFHIKTRSELYPAPSLSYSSRQRKEFPWSQANPKIKRDPEKVQTLAENM